MTDTITWGEVQGQPITFPMEVEELNAATVLYSVPAPAAAALLPGDAFEVVEIAPGTAQLVIAACDYVREPVGRLRRAQPRLPGPARRGAGRRRRVVRLPHAGEPGLHLRGRQPGHGLPQDRRGPRRSPTRRRTASFRLAMGGQHVLTLTVPRAAPVGEPERIQADELLVPRRRALHDEPPDGDGHRLRGPGGRSPRDRPRARRPTSCARSGCPKTPDMAAWGESLSATFLLGRPI